MRNAGIGINSAIRGFQDTRDRRRRAEEFDEQSEHSAWERERQRRLAGQMDPMRVEGAGLELKGRRRRDSRDEFADEYIRKDWERKDRFGARQDEYGEATQDFRISAAEREHEYGEATQDYRLSAADREHEYGEATQPHRLSASRREHEYGEKTQPYRMRAADQADRAGQYADTERTAQAGASEYMRSARNALSNFGMTGNPMYLEDHYNEMMPDGNTAKITKLPDGRYRNVVTDARGEVIAEKVATKEELLAASEKFFMQAPALDDHPRAQPDDRDTSAYTDEVNSRARDYYESGQFDSMIEARMQAHADASSRQRKNPREAAADFYADTLKQLIPSSTWRTPRQEDIEDARRETARLTEEFMTRFYGRDGQGGQGARGGGLGGGSYSPGGGVTGTPGGGVDTSHIPDQAIEKLRMNDSPAARQEFDRHFGVPGAADSLLGGRR